jgi:hypothetical protein
MEYCISSHVRFGLYQELHEAVDDARMWAARCADLQVSYPSVEGEGEGRGGGGRGGVVCMWESERAREKGKLLNES